MGRREQFCFQKNYSNSEIILAQLKKIKPDVVLFINTASLPSDIRVNIKNNSFNKIVRDK